MTDLATILTRVPTGESLALLLVTNLRFSAEVPTVVHRPIGRSTADFTVHPAGPRSGTYNLLCASEADALALYNLLRAPGPFTLADADTSIADAKFLVTGHVGIESPPETSLACLVTADYTETP